jgi:hypothetical protein
VNLAREDSPHKKTAITKPYQSRLSLFGLPNDAGDCRSPKAIADGGYTGVPLLASGSALYAFFGESCTVATIERGGST